MNKTNIIVINGRRYDAVTGEVLDHPTNSHHTTHHDHASHTAPHPAAKPPARGTPAYRPTKHIAPHARTRSSTLMRQAVKKPQPTPKRRIRVQGRLGANGYQASKIVSHRPAKPSHTRPTRHHAVKGSKGDLISHFSPHLFSTVDYVPPARIAATIGHAAHTAVAPPGKPTTDELLEYAVQHAGTPQHQTHRRGRGILRRRA